MGNNNFLEFDDFDFGFDQEEELDGFVFTFSCKFKIIDFADIYCMDIVTLYKRSYKEKEEMEIIMKNFPMSINDINGIEIGDFDLNKTYTGEFIVNFYENKTFDIFLRYIK